MFVTLISPITSLTRQSCSCCLCLLCSMTDINLWLLLCNSATAAFSFSKIIFWIRRIFYQKKNWKYKSRTFECGAASLTSFWCAHELSSLQTEITQPLAPRHSRVETDWQDLLRFRSCKRRRFLDLTKLHFISTLSAVIAFYVLGVFFIQTVKLFLSSKQFLYVPSN